jgi:hypothetical protein
VCLSSSSNGPLLHGERLQKDLSDLYKKMSRKTVTLDQIRNVTFSKDVREVSTVLLPYCVLGVFSFASIIIFVNITPLNYIFIHDSFPTFSPSFLPLFSSSTFISYIINYFLISSISTLISTSPSLSPSDTRRMREKLVSSRAAMQTVLLNT